MSRFLLVFDRRTGLRSITEYPDSASAVAARLAAEAENAADLDTEVVVLAARSEAGLRVTHARYFENVNELARSTIAGL